MKRILSIDGGGIRGVFPAAFLTNLEKGLEHPIGNYFDLIAGTSTGGIIALGLALGMKASKILEFYEEKGSSIFPKKNWWQKLHPEFLRKPYDSKPLKLTLEEVFNDKKLGEAQTRLLIPAWVKDRSNNPCCIFKTAHHKNYQYDYKRLIVDVAMGTAAAPTFFERYLTRDNIGLVDGGLWANNPIALAVIEAISVLEWNPIELKVLSISCLEQVVEMEKSYSRWTIKNKIADFFMTGQSDSALNMAKILIGYPSHRDSIYRISHEIPKSKHSTDDVNNIEYYKGIANDRARTETPNLQTIFFSDPAEKFTPIHRL